MRIRLLGTGTPNPSLKRMSSGCLVEIGEDVIVFDHGPGAFHRLLETGIDITRVSHLISGRDVLVHMCHQLSGTQPGPEWARDAAGHLEAAQTDRDAGVRNLVLTHIPEQIDVPGVREKLIHEVSEVFKGNVFWGEDLMEISVKDPKPLKHKG